MRSFPLGARLFGTYLLLIALTVGAFSVAFIVILNTRPAPPQQTYLRLAAIAQGIPLREILAEAALNSDNSEAVVESQLTEIAESRNVRILVVNGWDGPVLFDSAGTLDQGTELSLNRESYTIPAALRRGFSPRVETIFGNFQDPEGQWLFAGLIATGPLGPRSAALLFADPPENQSLQQALADFTNALAWPLCQSAMIGLVLASILAILVSRTIARPLQMLAGAAAEVAEGHYNQEVPVSGPPEVRAVAETFNYMTGQVRRTQQAQQDFLANVSHDLKTPLTSIQGYSQAIIDGAASDPVEAARIIHEEASRLNRMVMELMDLARLQAGRLSLRATPLDLGQIVEAVGQRLAIVARDKGVDLQVNSAPLPDITGDGDRLAQVLVNLVSNAIHYTPRGGYVYVQTRVANGGVEVSVRDNGIGIPADELPRIFERFYQVDKARGPERGTGLGLAIAQEIIQAHGGTITVTSAGTGRGTTFTVWLPSSQVHTVTTKRR